MRTGLRLLVGQGVAAARARTTIFLRFIHKQFCKQGYLRWRRYCRQATVRGTVYQVSRAALIIPVSKAPNIDVVGLGGCRYSRVGMATLLLYLYVLVFQVSIVAKAHASSVLFSQRFSPLFMRTRRLSTAVSSTYKIAENDV